MYNTIAYSTRNAPPAMGSQAAGGGNQGGGGGALPTILWNVDMAGTNPSQAQPISGGHNDSLTVSGSSGFQFSTIIGAGLSHKVETGMYLSIECPAVGDPNEGVYVMLDEREFSSHLHLAQPATAPHAAVAVIQNNVQGGNEASPVEGEFAVAVNIGDALFGVEFATTGVYIHYNGTRNKLRDPFGTAVRLSAAGFKFDESPTSFTLDPDPDTALFTGMEGGLVSMLNFPNLQTS